ncbi:Carboxymuconolactone decarboxylase [Maridesulfovibrio salexigens DSM 2638]|uniref:Carboxymuconolactone decarboxylase n=2 Tax=Maridesulfovibrio salexigens TaxID=880 RepID=C6BTC8_MARSD|nr:Carboxymuconolactone decarboxylase [Maridesulfovibrio salexigens DSM 2638]
MHTVKSISTILTIAFILSLATLTEANNMNTETNLNARQQSIVTIAAFTASGDIEKLKPALTEGLEAGLSINEIKEVLVQMYAYTGFPRALNGMAAFMSVVKDRKANGIKDVEGKEASPVPADFNKDEYGAKVRAKLAGLDKDISGAEWQRFSPIMDTFLKKHLFADIFVRDVLTEEERELATIAALANMSGTEGQLFFHYGAAMNSGLTKEQMNNFIEVLDSKVDNKQAQSAKEVLTGVLAKRNQ